jgi:hypothetical protein
VSGEGCLREHDVHLDRRITNGRYFLSQQFHEKFENKNVYNNSKNEKKKCTTPTALKKTLPAQGMSPRQ